MAIRRKDLPEYDLSRPSASEVADSVLKTKESLETSISGKIAVTQIGSELLREKKDYYVGYGDKTIKMYEQQPDPMEPVKFKFRRVPRGPAGDRVPIERSPPRKVSPRTLKAWKIPPCISNWKNAKGYTLPLEMRLSADGRYLKEHGVSDQFSKLSETLHAAENAAKEEITLRQELRRKLTLKEAIAKEQEMRELADQAKKARLKLVTEEQSSSDEERDNIRYERGLAIERNARLEKRKGKGERDLAEQIALGEANIERTTVFDSRLFNQNHGLDAGFGSEDEYDVYDQPLFKDRSAANIYRNVRDPNFDEVIPAKRRPVEFERHDIN